MVKLNAERAQIPEIVQRKIQEEKQAEEQRQR
jgi:hypothetical protein